MKPNLIIKVDLVLVVFKEREANLKMIKANFKLTINPPKTLSFTISLDATINTYKV